MAGNEESTNVSANMITTLDFKMVVRSIGLENILNELRINLEQCEEFIGSHHNIKEIGKVYWQFTSMNPSLSKGFTDLHVHHKVEGVRFLFFWVDVNTSTGLFDPSELTIEEYRHSSEVNLTVLRLLDFFFTEHKDECVSVISYQSMRKNLE